MHAQSRTAAPQRDQHLPRLKRPWSTWGLTSVAAIGPRDSPRAAHPAPARLPMRTLLTETTTPAGLAHVLVTPTAPPAAQKHRRPR